MIAARGDKIDVGQFHGVSHGPPAFDRSCPNLWHLAMVGNDGDLFCGHQLEVGQRRGLS